MKGQLLKILFRSGKAYLTLHKGITLEQLTNLPPFARKSKSTAYWKIKVLNYIPDEKKLFCEILSYHTGETNFENNQIKLSEKLSEIQYLSFRSIDTIPLFRTLVRNNRRSKSFSSNSYKEETPQKSGQIEPFTKEVLKINIDETFFFPLKNANFKIGHVSFKKKFLEYPKSIEIKIYNSDIKEEYDAVKNYFCNVLKTKKIQVQVNIDIEDDKILSSKVNSPEIDRINKQLIDEVRINFVKSTTKKKTEPEKDNNLFTIEEYFETLTNDDFELKTFYDNDEKFLEDLLRISDSKHYKHLRLLSSKHSHEIMKIRYIHKPFSFVFLIEGPEYYHFVWETLNTEEATYVWHINKEIDILKPFLIKIEEIIKRIKIDGKLDYITNSQDNFIRIFHDYSDSKKGFIKWKKQLEKILNWNDTNSNNLLE